MTKYWHTHHINHVKTKYAKEFLETKIYLILYLCLRRFTWTGLEVHLKWIKNKYAVYGVAQSRTQLKRLSSSNSSIQWTLLDHEKSFPGSSVGKEYACKAGDTGDTGSIPGMGRSSGGRNGNPFQYPCLEKSWIEEPGVFREPHPMCQGWGRRPLGMPRPQEAWAEPGLHPTQYLG